VLLKTSQHAKSLQPEYRTKTSYCRKSRTT